MDSFYESLNNELGYQKKLLEKCMDDDRYPPAGYLFVRPMKNHALYYQVVKRKTKEGWKTRHKNITGDVKLIKRLSIKAANKKLRKIYETNISAMEKVLSAYCPLTVDLLPEKCREVLRKENSLEAGYEKAPFDPKAHIHGTACGIMVRSKSEALVANALWHYGIPFRYEEKFYHPDGSGEYFYPDFTIRLPDGRKIIWEQLGLLSKLGYCEDTARKLNAYQQGGFVIGKNLILTQDDLDGGCDSAFIYHIIENYILPYFK
ncbi:MAG: hypothetical protein J6M22_04000 [Firmicutes bacterium]|nr:hypothetical protein [Bacillota bacterium]